MRPLLRVIGRPPIEAPTGVAIAVATLAVACLTVALLLILAPVSCIRRRRRRGDRIDLCPWGDELPVRLGCPDRRGQHVERSLGRLRGRTSEAQGRTTSAGLLVGLRPRGVGCPLPELHRLPLRRRVHRRHLEMVRPHVRRAFGASTDRGADTGRRAGRGRTPLPRHVLGRARVLDVPVPYGQCHRRRVEFDADVSAGTTVDELVAVASAIADRIEAAASGTPLPAAPSPTPEPSFPYAAETALLSRVPTGFRETCERTDHHEPKPWRRWPARQGLGRAQPR